MLLCSAQCDAHLEMLSQGHTPKIESKNKPGVTALREIAAGKVGIEMLKKVPL